MDTRNDIALSDAFHFLLDVTTHPYCQKCGQTFKKSTLKAVMGQRCPGITQVSTAPTVSPKKSAPRRRLHGKQRPST